MLFQDSHKIRKPEKQIGHIRDQEQHDQLDHKKWHDRFGYIDEIPVGNRSGNILTRATTVIAVVFLVSVAGYAYVNRIPESANIEAAARQLEGEEAGVFQWWNVDESGGGTSESDTAPADLGSATESSGGGSE